MIKRMITYDTTALCPRCGKPMRTSDVESYAFTCFNCNENFYNYEVNDLCSDWFEINVPMSAREYMEKRQGFITLCEDMGADFLGYDDSCSIVDIGFGSRWFGDFEPQAKAKKQTAHSVNCDLPRSKHLVIPGDLEISLIVKALANTEWASIIDDAISLLVDSADVTDEDMDRVETENWCLRREELIDLLNKQKAYASPEELDSIIERIKKTL